MVDKCVNVGKKLWKKTCSEGKFARIGYWNFQYGHCNQNNMNSGSGMRWSMRQNRKHRNWFKYSLK
jgi:hypothetical protein